MPRIRTVKPEFFTHPEITRLSMPARLLFLSLLTQADDEGRMYDQVRKIDANAFGERDVIDTRELLAELSREGRIIRYEVDGKRCIQIQNFSRHQAISHRRESTLPPVPEGFQEPSGNVQGTLQEPSGNLPGGNGMEGKGTKYLPPMAPVETPNGQNGSEGWFQKPNGWSDTEAALYRRLLSVSDVWKQLTPAGVNLLHQKFSRPLVTVALQHLVEERAVPRGDPYPMLQAVCMNLQETSA
jgi:hypothetical protein